MIPGTLHKIFTMRLSIQEDHDLSQMAKALGVKSRARVIRKWIRHGLGQGPDLLQEDLHTLREGIRQLGGLGRNMNQIARAINAGQAPTCSWDPNFLSLVHKEVRTLAQEWIAAVARSRKGVDRGA